MNGIYENRENLQLYINRIKKRLKTKNNVLIYIDDDLIYNDVFIIGLIYKVQDIKNNKKYIGSEEKANGWRQRQHIPKAIYKFKRREKLNKIQRHIINHKNELKIFVDEVYEIVIYKKVEKLYEREQYYIDLFDTINKGLNTRKAKINETIQEYNKKRFKAYDKTNNFFRKYGQQLMKFKDRANEHFKTNQPFNFYKESIESKKETIEDFIDIYCYDKEEQAEQFNILYNYILYEQKRQNKKYYYEPFNETDDEKPFNETDYEKTYNEPYYEKPFNETDYEKPFNEPYYENPFNKIIIDTIDINKIVIDTYENYEFINNNDISNKNDMIIINCL